MAGVGGLLAFLQEVTIGEGDIGAGRVQEEIVAEAHRHVTVHSAVHSGDGRRTGGQC